MRSLFAAALLGFTIGTPVSADVIYSTLGPGDSFVCCTGFTIVGEFADEAGDLDQGSPFVVAGIFALDSIDVAFTHLEGTNAGDIFLMRDTAGHPSSIIETFHFSDLSQFGPTAGIASATSVLHPVLIPGQYWIVASASGDSWLGFNWSDSSEIADRAMSRNGTKWVIDHVFPPAAFRIEGTPTTTPVPEPSTLLLLTVCAIGGSIRRVFKAL